MLKSQKIEIFKTILQAFNMGSDILQKSVRLYNEKS